MAGMAKQDSNIPDLSSALVGARSLLGWKLVHDSIEGRTSGYIVETEVYDEHDPASHAFGGIRKRNAAMFEAAGTIYVYFTYGMHYCMNIVTGDKGLGQGVLIRALQPLEGLDIMQRRRGIESKHQLTNGPAKLTQAMGVTKQNYGQSIFHGDIYLEPGIPALSVVQTTRIGISKAKELPWRFYLADNPYVSRI